MVMKIGNLRKCLLDHEDFVSCESCVSFYNDFAQS